jgi:hypothetical protein
VSDLIDLQKISSQISGAAGLNSGVIDTNPNPGTGQYGIVATAVTDPSNFYYKLTWGILFFVGTAAVLTLIYGGLLYLTARENAEQTERGKKAIIGAIAGIIIIAASFSAYATMMNVFSKSSETQTPAGAQQVIQENPFK